MQKNNKLLIFSLFWRFYQQIDAQRAENEIGNPCGKEGRQAARDGERLGDLHEEHIGKGDGDADAEVHAYASPNLPARQGRSDERQNQHGGGGRHAGVHLHLIGLHAL